jgi:hypothetical protein
MSPCHRTVIPTRARRVRQVRRPTRRRIRTKAPRAPNGRTSRPRPRLRPRPRPRPGESDPDRRLMLTLPTLPTQKHDDEGIEDLDYIFRKYPTSLNWISYRRWYAMNTRLFRCDDFMLPLSKPQAKRLRKPFDPFHSLSLHLDSIRHTAGIRGIQSMQPQQPI